MTDNQPNPPQQELGSDLMDIREFVEFGYLHEVNRRFFHPLGMALAVAYDEDDNLTLHGIIDHRDDEEGVYFTDPDFTKYANVSKEMQRRGPKRMAALGYWMQTMGTLNLQEEPPKQEPVCTCTENTDIDLSYYTCEKHRNG